ncbi:hydroxylamine reductase [bacterium]|nr:hydroxylamine reductase [candidate division CSSED10-310 bacterium]
MFCFQCQEAAKNVGCTVRGVCGKPDQTATWMDLLIHTLKGIGVWGEKAVQAGLPIQEEGEFIARAMFSTITNANFDTDRIRELIREALAVRDALASRVGTPPLDLPDAATWSGNPDDDLLVKAHSVGVLATENEDIRSLRELLIIGLKGLCAYSDHASILGYHNNELYAFMMKALASTTKSLTLDAMIALVMECGAMGVKGMALLDQANTETFGHPEMTRVRLDVDSHPGILISGHDLRDMKDLLEQTVDTGIDVYTHSEMLPANYYPAFKKYAHFVGNYGSSWWNQSKEFEQFHGPILFTTNCITPVKDSYKDRVYTTGMAGYPGCRHIPDRKGNAPKDFSEIIERARQCAPPDQIESGEIIGGFAHNQLMAFADQIIAAVKAGTIRRFIVMAGCDGRQPGRQYYTDVAKALPADTIILTAGCAKYRYNKLNLGDIGGIPRVLDAGQCNDSYSLAYIALQLKEAFGLSDINDLPISYDIAWYEQKAVIVLLALLSLGVKGIRLGPTLPAFLSPAVANVLVDSFNIQPIATVEGDVAAMLQGK